MRFSLVPAVNLTYFVIFPRYFVMSQVLDCNLYTSNAQEYEEHSKKLQQSFVGRRLENEVVDEVAYQQVSQRVACY